MKIIDVPIFTEEYSIGVIVGTVEELAKYISKNCSGWSYEQALEQCQNTRGSAWNRLPKEHPIITLDVDLPYEMALATLPHEACHAAGFIIEHLGIKEEVGGEFMGHCVSAVVRHTLKALLRGKKLKAVKTV